jgi:hypothetical protein
MSPTHQTIGKRVGFDPHGLVKGARRRRGSLSVKVIAAGFNPPNLGHVLRLQPPVAGPGASGRPGVVPDLLPGLRGWEFCTICPFFANFFTFTKIPQVPSFQAHSPVKTVFAETPKNAPKSQNTPSTNPYQNETQISLKFPSERHLRTRPTTQKCTLPSRDFRHKLPSKLL